ITNPRFRPDFMVRPPEQDLKREVLRWSSEAPAIYVNEASIDHFYVEAAHGERVLDAHPAGHQSLVLHVPAERPLFVRLNDESAEYVVNEHVPLRLETLTPTTPSIGNRGAINLAFEKLFARPFGNADVLSFTRRTSTQTVVDAPPRDPLRSRELVSTISGSIAVGAAATSLTLGIVSAERYFGGAEASQVEVAKRNRQVHQLNVASLAFLVVAGAAGVTWGWTRLRTETGVSLETSSSGTGMQRGAVLSLYRAF
ncbi:MAG: hypothetical protein ACM3ZE_22125, partial [Myxococcales bacterium]